jgi:hypothetical protein
VKPTHGSLSTEGRATSRPHRRAASLRLFSGGAAGNRTRCKSVADVRKRRVWQRETTRKYVKRPPDTRQALTASTRRKRLSRPVLGLAGQVAARAFACLQRVTCAHDLAPRR